MAKINDTTTYPNTTPVLADHIPGTDVSNTGNDANGETVTFTFQAIMDLFEPNLSITESQISDLGSYLPLGGGTMSGNLDMDGNELILDADGDSSITADVDDRMDFRIGGGDVLNLTNTVAVTSALFDYYGALFANNENLTSTNESHFGFESSGTLAGEQTSVVNILTSGAMSGAKSSVLQLHAQSVSSTAGFVLRLESEDANVGLIHAEDAAENEVFKVAYDGDITTLGAIELGHASDTTISRASAGVIAVEGDNVLMDSNIGTDVQAHGAVLDDLNTLGAVTADAEFLVGTGAGAFAWESGATARASLGLTIGSDVQAFDALLADIAAITGWAKGDLLVYDGSDLIRVGAGSNDEVLTADSAEASGVKWAAAAASGFLDLSSPDSTTTYNSSGTWTKSTDVPAGSNLMMVELWGAGGSGEKENSDACGGGAGAYVRYFVDPSLCNATETITIGAGGAAKTSNGNGNDGGDTTFKNLIADGGRGGSFSSSSGGKISISVLVSDVGNEDTGGQGSILHENYYHLTWSEYGGVADLDSDAATRFFAGAAGGSDDGGSLNAAGTSDNGGNGGAAADSGNATAGSQPGGGGGGSTGNDSGAGGDGRVKISYYTV